jgi:hypothetical protein
MPLSPLAREIYKVLRLRVPAIHPEMTYKQLAEPLPPLGKPFEDVGFHDPRLDQALADTVHACRAVGLPALSAIVVNAETKKPGKRYYAEAHPSVGGDIEKEVAWAREMELAKITSYPTELPGLDARK